MRDLKTTTLLGIAVVLTIVAALVLSLMENSKRQSLYSITSFDDCAAAGYPIMESYPERCSTPDGRMFVNESQQLAQTSGSISSNGCAIAGCSQTLCVSVEESSDIVTTCEYRPEYVCYKDAVCEPQADGRCGWTETKELNACLANPPQL